MKIFPTLYKLTSKCALQEWTITVDGSLIVTRFGQTGGTIQESVPTVCSGKNTGRANETTPEEQALIEAQAQWEQKQRSKNYTVNKEDGLEGKASDLVEGGILPMLAHKYNEYGEKLIYPACVQPKLDGHRCIAVVDIHGKCALWSRARRQILSMPHIIREIESLKLNDVAFDGELYHHDYRHKFEELTGLIRQSSPKEGHEIVQYHIFDAAVPGEFVHRYNIIDDNIHGNDTLRGVETLPVDSEDDLMLAFERFIEQGYEGAIARNLNGFYENKRSYNLLKLKQFDDAEFLCISVEEGVGKMTGHGIFVCQTDLGTAFKAKMAGELEELRKYYENPELVIGKHITIKYQGLTNRSGVPRFAIALRIREDI